MARTSLIIGTAVLIILIVLVAFLYFRSISTQEPQQQPNGAFPISTSTSPAAPEDMIRVPTQGGDSFVTRDFIDNGVTIEDPANAGNYYLSGSSGYCYADGTCPSAEVSPDFSIVYFSQEGSFVIGLNREPLGESRRGAETYLMETLGLSNTQLCSLKYYVGTTVHVNSVYGSMGNLGFSFCPNAVVLP